MILFDEFDGIKFYDGIDYEFVLNYNKKELIVIFIENWKKEELRFTRDAKIKSLLENKEYKKLDDINNMYIVIYQTNGYLEIMAESVKKKFMSNSTVNNYKPILQTVF